jgi:hypothetical protein
MLDPKDLFTKAMEAAEDYADKEHAAGVLEDALDALKGLLVAEYKSKGEPITTIKDIIKNDPRYKESVSAWRDAVKAFRIAKLKYDQVCRFQDNVRTNEATARRLAT